MRNKFMSIICALNDQLIQLDINSLYVYTMLSHDVTIVNQIGTFFKKVYNFTKEYKLNMPGKNLKKWIDSCRS